MKNKPIIIIREKQLFNYIVFAWIVIGFVGISYDVFYKAWVDEYSIDFFDTRVHLYLVTYLFMIVYIIAFFRYHLTIKKKE